MRFPSITALRALDAVARLGSVSAAALELNLTRSAISHRINTLEEHLGFLLTERTGRGVKLTDEGERYAREIQKILISVHEASKRSDGEKITGRLCVSCNPGFASYWLCQHIGSFLQQFPQVRLQVISPRTTDDVSNTNADVYIAYGVGDWPNHVVSQIVGLYYFPVCSPRIINSKRGLKTPGDLEAYTLLHMNDYSDWRTWLSVIGANDIDVSTGVLFADAHCAISACIAAQGVSIGDNLISGDALTRGLLVRPFELSIRSNRGYYLVADPLKSERPVVKAFSEWLKTKVLATTPHLDGIFAPDADYVC
ncbi:LysR substrate-binding domain-containing protein [Serratia marcescens]|uniref:LysR substrate-binding domain-containing protein n=1 Tax=Serratia marcescens TaxID=615 RepID=UPI0040359522